MKIDCKAVVASAASACVDRIEKITDRFEVLEAVGQGSCGVVRRAKRRSDAEEVALKVIRSADEETIEIARAEFSVLQRIDHPNIVRALDFFTTIDGAVLVLSYFDGNQLNTAVSNAACKQFSELTSHRLFVSLLQALHHLHENRIVHRDVKPENVMVSSDLCDLRLVDFNISRYLPEGEALSPNCTPAYAAPEVRRGGSPSEASDIWGAGLCLCLMLSGKCPQVDSRVQQVSVKDSRLAAISESCRKTLWRCLTLEESARPAAMSLLQTPWVLCGPSADGVMAASLRKRSNSYSPLSLCEGSVAHSFKRSNSSSTLFSISTEAGTPLLSPSRLTTSPCQSYLAVDSDADEINHVVVFSRAMSCG